MNRLNSVYVFCEHVDHFTLARVMDNDTYGYILKVTSIDHLHGDSDLTRDIQRDPRRDL